MTRVTASAVAEVLGKPLRGKDIEIVGPSSLDNIQPGRLVFANKFSEERLARLNSSPEALALVTPEFGNALQGSFIVVRNPRLAFAVAVAALFAPKPKPGVARTAILGENVQIAEEVSIGEYCVIGNNVVIGHTTEIRNHVIISPGTRIGNHCLIKSHAVIGEEGFGFEYDDAGTPVRLPHLGIVEIGNHVEIGAGTVIARGTLDSTKIGNNAKIDDLVFLAHNVSIGENSFVIANAEISGSVKVGRGVWVGPAATVINGVEIGDRALIGIGAVVTKSVDAETKVAGNPARVIGKREPQGL